MFPVEVVLTADPGRPGAAVLHEATAVLGGLAGAGPVEHVTLGRPQVDRLHAVLFVRADRAWSAELLAATAVQDALATSLRAGSFSARCQVLLDHRRPGPAVAAG